MVIINRTFLFFKENKKVEGLPSVVILHQGIQNSFLIKQKANPVQRSPAKRLQVPLICMSIPFFT